MLWPMTPQEAPKLMEICILNFPSKHFQLSDLVHGAIRTQLKNNNGYIKYFMKLKILENQLFKKPDSYLHNFGSKFFHLLKCLQRLNTLAIEHLCNTHHCSSVFHHDKESASFQHFEVIFFQYYFLLGQTRKFQ